VGGGEGEGEDEEAGRGWKLRLCGFFFLFNGVNLYLRYLFAPLNLHPRSFRSRRATGQRRECEGDVQELPVTAGIWMANWQFSQFTRFKLAHVNWFDPPCSSRTSQSVQSVLHSVLNWFVRLGGLPCTTVCHPYFVRSCPHNLQRHHYPRIHCEISGTPLRFNGLRGYCVASGDDSQHSPSVVGIVSSARLRPIS
jgi:hypothetical protein